MPTLPFSLCRQRSKMVPILTEGFPGLLRRGRSGVPSYLRTIGMSRLRCLGVLTSLPFAKKKKSQDFASFFFRWTFGAKWWMNRTKLGLCMLYLRNEVYTTHIYISGSSISEFIILGIPAWTHQNLGKHHRFLLTVLIWVWSSRWETRAFFQNPKKGANGIRKDIDSLTNQYITYLHGSIIRYYYMTSWCMI